MFATCIALLARAVRSPASLALTLLATSCSEPEPVEAPPQDEELAAFLASGAKWDSPNIDVCWKTAGYETQKHHVEHAVHSAFVRTPIRFRFIGLCSAITQQPAQLIRVQITEQLSDIEFAVRALHGDQPAEGARVTKLGRLLNSPNEEVALNFTFRRWKKSCQGREQECYTRSAGKAPLPCALAKLCSRIVRVGGEQEREVDVRVVAATHRDLPRMVALGQFREDLLYRLDAFTVHVPPLRQRREEIEPLAQLFLRRCQARWSLPVHHIGGAVLERLQAYAWPGNVRQLRNVVERAAVVCRGDTLELDDLPDQLFTTLEAAALPAAKPAEPAGERLPSLPERLRQFERELLREALTRTRGNQSEAARLLGLPRRTLANKVHAYGLLGETSGHD